MEMLDSLIGAVRRCCEGFPDKRTGTNTRYPMVDVGLGAFSLFFTQSPSFLAFQRRLEEGHGHSNCQTLFGMSRIPSAPCLTRSRPITCFRCSARWSRRSSAPAGLPRSGGSDRTC